MAKPMDLQSLCALLNLEMDSDGTVRLPIQKPNSQSIEVRQMAAVKHGATVPSVDYSTMSVKEAVDHFVKLHPEADSHEVAGALNANQKTVYVYMKGYAENRGNGGGPATEKRGPGRPRKATAAPELSTLDRAKAQIDQLAAETLTVSARIEEDKATLKAVKDQIAKLREVVKLLEA
jgi:transposase-like protein